MTPFKMNNILACLEATYINLFLSRMPIYQKMSLFLCLFMCLVFANSIDYLFSTSILSLELIKRSSFKETRDVLSDTVIYIVIVLYPDTTIN